MTDPAEMISFFRTCYEFPSCEADRLMFIERHARSGRQWVSTSVENGHQRMKFEPLDEWYSRDGR